jgi:sigma-B regulation protein RsbU (phosphoserine phosphatase)
MSGDAEQQDGADRLELALRASNEGIWDWWVKRGDISYSRPILEFFECSESAAPNLFLPPHEPVHPQDLEAFRRALAQALARGGPETLVADCRVRTGSGGWRWLRIRGTVVRDREGEAVRVAGSMIDISRRKLAEEQLQEERHLFRELIDNVPLQIYFKDKESKFALANQKMAEWMGLKNPAGLVGKHDKDFFGPEHWQTAEEDERRIMESGTPVTDLLERETWRVGDETWVLTSKFPWHDRHGEVCGTFGVSSNVTELVISQRKASALATELRARNQAYEEEVQLAREIQQAMVRADFPDMRLGGKAFRFDARYVPISGLAGDFFEVFPISEGRVGLLICDVMGHGVRSALVVAMLRGLIERERYRASEPAALLGGLNEGLYSIFERTDVTLFATALYAVVDLATGSLEYACAGHPGAVVCRPSGVSLFAAGAAEKGPALGLMRGPVYPYGAISLGDVEGLVFFTDGILEVRNAQDEEFGVENLLQVIHAAADADVSDLLGGILDRVRAFSGAGHFDDDVCLLGLKVVRE